MSVGVIWLASIAALVVSATVGASAAKADSKRLTSAMMAVTIASMAVLAVTTLVGLWQAWAPWELTRK